MSLKQQLQDDLKEAMRGGEAARRDVLRLMMAAIKQAEVDGQKTLNDAEVQEVLTKQAKQRRESISDYENAGRADLAAGEQAELVIIEAYLPQMMSEAEVRAVASGLIAELGVTDAKGMGQVMGRLMAQLKGKADGRLVNQVVRDLLQ
ncbi:MAG: GatB/YqeY domain-containing protein [Anaerolineales bacterium]|nr:GatB/YqeY domain-containing protein [Anaerolineales bacterium]